MRFENLADTENHLTELVDASAQYIPINEAQRPSQYFAQTGSSVLGTDEKSD